MNPTSLSKSTFRGERFSQRLPCSVLISVSVHLIMFILQRSRLESFFSLDWVKNIFIQANFSTKRLSSTIIKLFSNVSREKVYILYTFFLSTLIMRGVRSTQRILFYVCDYIFSINIYCRFTIKRMFDFVKNCSRFLTANAYFYSDISFLPIRLHLLYKELIQSHFSILLSQDNCYKFSTESTFGFVINCLGEGYFSLRKLFDEVSYFTHLCMFSSIEA